MRLFLFLAVALLGAWPAAAQTSPRDNVADQLEVVADVQEDEGFARDPGPLGRATLLGVLEADASVHLEVALEPGREYHIAAACDERCASLDIRIMTPAFDLLVEDVGDSALPRLEARPEVAGPHLLSVRMSSCAAGICYFGVVVLSRSAAP